MTVRLATLRHLLMLLASMSIINSTYATASSPSSLEISLGNRSLRGADFVLEYGLLRKDMPLNLRVRVRTLLDEPLPVKVIPSASLSVSWAENKEVEKSTELLDRKHPKWLSISLNPTDEDPVPILKLYNSQYLFATVSFSFILEDYRLPVQQGGAYRGAWPSAVELCLGKPPEGYRLDCLSLRINGIVPHEPKGPCGPTLICTTRLACDSDPVRPNGYCTTAQVFGVAGVVNYSALLTADYVLNEPSPRLELFSDLLRESRLRKMKAGCSADLKVFLEKHGGDSGFETRNEDRESPGVHFRSEPCDPLQFSVILDHTFSSGDWVNMPYAGVRLKTSGATVLVGLLPSGEPFFNHKSVGGPVELGIPGPSSSLEIEVIRDSQYIVGAFRVGVDSPGPGSFNFGSGVMTFDRPPAGTHIYTLKAKYVGKESKATVLVLGRLLAYQLDRDGLE